MADDIEELDKPEESEKERKKRENVFCGWKYLQGVQH